jgi:hypothetical protein
VLEEAETVGGISAILLRERESITDGRERLKKRPTLGPTRQREHKSERSRNLLMRRGGGEADQSGPHDSQTGCPARATVTGNAGPQDSRGEGGKRREGGYVGCAGSRSGLHRIKGDGPLVNISA